MKIIAYHRAIAPNLYCFIAERLVEKYGNSPLCCSYTLSLTKWVCQAQYAILHAV